MIVLLLLIEWFCIDWNGKEVQDSRPWTKIDEFPVIQSDLIKWRDKLVAELIAIMGEE